MEKKPGKGTKDGYNDFLESVTEIARRNEDEAVKEGLDRVKVGEEISTEMGMRIKSYPAPGNGY
jgi:hypothetical protein